MLSVMTGVRRLNDALQSLLRIKNAISKRLRHKLNIGSSKQCHMESNSMEFQLLSPGLSATSARMTKGVLLS